MDVHYAQACSEPSHRHNLQTSPSTYSSWPPKVLVVVKLNCKGVVVEVVLVVAVVVVVVVVVLVALVVVVVNHFEMSSCNGVDCFFWHRQSNMSGK